MPIITTRKIALTGLAKSGKSTVAEYLTNPKEDRVKSYLSSPSLFTELSFANPIKEIVKSLFGIDDKYLYDNDYKNNIIPEIGVSARSLLQNIGTELFRVELNKLLPDLKIKNIWIHKLGLQLKELRDPSGCDPSGCDPSGCDPSGCDPSGCDPSGCDPSGCDPSGSEPLVVVSDVRFDDEYQFLKDNGFTIVKINRPNLNEYRNNRLNEYNRNKILSDFYKNPNDQGSLYNHVSESGCKYDIEIQNDSSLEELYKKIDNIVYKSDLLKANKIIEDWIEEGNKNKVLDLSNLNLRILPKLPSNLFKLKINNNLLTELPSLSSDLKLLDCSYNKLISLSNLPTDLRHLFCENNQLNSLPKLPNKLSILCCCTNKLTILPNLNNKLLILDCGENKLTSLPNLPNSLEILYCFDNFLTSLPDLQTDKHEKGLQELHCGVNKLTSLPELPNSLQKLYCGINDFIKLELPDRLKKYSDEFEGLSLYWMNKSCQYISYE